MKFVLDFLIRVEGFQLTPFVDTEENLSEDGLADVSVHDSENSSVANDDENNANDAFINEVFNKMQMNRSRYIAGEDSEEFKKLFNEAKTLMDLNLNATSLVKDSRHFNYLCNLVREMAENL